MDKALTTATFTPGMLQKVNKLTDSIKPSAPTVNTKCHLHTPPTLHTHNSLYNNIPSQPHHITNSNRLGPKTLRLQAHNPYLTGNKTNPTNTPASNHHHLKTSPPEQKPHNQYSTHHPWSDRRIPSTTQIPSPLQTFPLPWPAYLHHRRNPAILFNTWCEWLPLFAGNFLTLKLIFRSCNPLD